MIVALFVAAWIDTPTGGRPATADHAAQLVSYAVFVLPATVIVGVLFAFIPPRHRILRTALLVPLALYAAGLGALFTFTGPSIDTALGPERGSVSTPARLVGFAALTVAWFAGRVAEEIAVAMRRPGRRR